MIVWLVGGVLREREVLILTQWRRDAERDKRSIQIVLNKQERSTSKNLN